MPQDPESVWKDEYKKIPPATDFLSGPRNLATFVDQRVTGKLVIDPGLAKMDPPPTFTWTKALFQTQLLLLAPTPDPISGIIKMVGAWTTATQASFLVIAPGTKIEPPPAGTNGIVGAVVAIMDPPSVTLASAAFLANMLAADAPPDQADSIFPVECFKAFSKLTFTITGIDTTAPTPLPIVMPLTGVK